MEFTAQLDVDVVALEAEDEVTCLVKRRNCAMDFARLCTAHFGSTVRLRRTWPLPWTSTRLRPTPTCARFPRHCESYPGSPLGTRSLKASAASESLWPDDLVAHDLRNPITISQVTGLPSEFPPQLFHHLLTLKGPCYSFG